MLRIVRYIWDRYRTAAHPLKERGLAARRAFAQVLLQVLLHGIHASKHHRTVLPALIAAFATSVVEVVEVQPQLWHAA